MCFLYQDFQQNKIQGEVEQANHQIPEELYPALHVGIVEHNIFRHKKANRERDTE
jgi:hypothetical protein